MSIPPEKFLGSTLQISLVDQRIIEGILMVIDPFGNILLGEAKEVSSDKLNPEVTRRRELGLVSVPKTTIVEVLMDSRSHKAVFG